MTTEQLEKLKRFFWKRVVPLPGNACWEWQAGLSTKPRRYGNISVYFGKEIGIKCFLAHRASWIIHHGPIPDGMQVCHKCDNPLCVRPDHLFLGTQSDNIQDAIAKGRFWQLTQFLPERPPRPTHCPAGHAYDEKNTGVSIRPDGSKNRYCRACHRERARKQRMAAA